MLKGKHIIVGITGGIAAFKTATLVRLLVKAGAEVQVIMTPNAREFITPVTMSTLSGKPVISEFFTANTGQWNSHVDLGLWADAMVVAPATASTIAKMAHGVADNMLVTNLTSHLRVAFTKAGILFYHLQSEYLVTMLTDRELNVIDPIRSSALFPQQNKENPVVYTTALWPWYEDYYLLSGYRFRNTGSTKTRRPVYFINKLRYQ